MKEILFEEVIENYKKLIFKMARKYQEYGDLDDLIQVGTIGLYEAYKRFDESFGVKFSSYSYKYILGQMIKYISNNRNTHFTSDQLKLYKSYEKTRSYLEQKNHKTPSLSEISSFMQVSVSDLEDALAVSSYTLSLDDEYNDEEAYNYYGIDYRDSIDDSLLINEEISKLDNINKQIINYRYYEDMSQCEVANKLGLSQAKVSRSEKYILEKIKRSIS